MLKKKNFFRSFTQKKTKDRQKICVKSIAKGQEEDKEEKLAPEI